MTFHQTCPCGSEIRLDFSPGHIGVRDSERQAERGEARKLIDERRTAHRPCLKRLGEPAPASREMRRPDHEDPAAEQLRRAEEAT